MDDIIKYQEGIKAYQAKNLERAEELFQEALEINDQNHKAWNALGIICSKIGKTKDALICFENALLIEPSNITYQNNFNKINKSLKKPVETKPISKAAIIQKNIKKPNKFLSFKTNHSSNNFSLNSNVHNQFEETDEPPFLYIPIFRYIGMSLLTVGIYDIYWLYKNYSFLKNRYGLKIDPMGRALFSILYFYDLFKRIHDDSYANNIKFPQFSESFIGLIFYLGVILQFISSYAIGETDYAILIWVFLGMQIFAIMQVQSYINDVISLEYPYMDYYGWSKGHIILIVLSLIYWIYIFSIY